MIDLLKEDRIVAFVGAGASALPPSNLPSWIQFNDLLLEALCNKLADYSRDRQPTDAMLAAFRARRDSGRFLAPDFQAQIMEEEVGADYFHVWQSLDTESYGPVHAALAELATRGRLAAIITTNFDSLIEAALREKGLEFSVFHDEKGFEALSAAKLEDSSALPLIKIHGSIEDATSLVDTLKQRVVGRPQSLLKILQNLLEKSAWLFLGFSGADFSYDPHYLGILDAAPRARGFVFLARPGSPVNDGVTQLRAAYGKEKASIVFGDLTSWLTEGFELPPMAASAKPARGEPTDPLPLVQGRIKTWVEGLGSMSVVNILYSMLKTSGMEAQALWLLRKTWKSYRWTDDIQGTSYDRYNYNYGLSLLEQGFIRNPVQLADDMSNMIEWKRHADENAYEFFARSFQSGNFLPAGAQLACVLTYRGEVGKAVGVMAEVTDQALDRENRLAFCDCAIASAVLYDITQIFTPAIGQLLRVLEITKQLGDEPRRALVCAHLGRFHTYAGGFTEADEFIREADRVAQRLDLRTVWLANQATRGLWLCDSGTSFTDAIQTLQEVADAIHSAQDVPLFVKMDLAQSEPTPVEVKGHNPMLPRVLLDLNRAGMLAGDSDVINRTLDELDELVVERFLGYVPHYYFGYAQCLLAGAGEDQLGLAKDLINRARTVGEQQNNPWTGDMAAHFEQQIELAGK